MRRIDAQGLYISGSYLNHILMAHLKTKLLVTLGVLATICFSASRDVEDIDRVKRRADGTYDVFCRNGTFENATADEIRDGQICGGVAAAEKIVCTGTGDTVYPTRQSDGIQLGSAVDGKVCRAIAEAVSGATVCTTTGGNAWWVTDMHSGNRLGTHTEFLPCLQATSVVQESLACVPYSGSLWRVTRETDWTLLGGPTDLALCTGAVGSARQGVGCVLKAADRWQMTRIQDGTPLGAITSFEACTLATRRAKAGKVCIHQGIGNWALGKIDTGDVVGSAVSLDACITQTNRNSTLADNRCTVSVVCPSYETISCSANDGRSQCDSGFDYVHCEWYDSFGKKHVDHQSC